MTAQQTRIAILVALLSMLAPFTLDTYLPSFQYSARFSSDRSTDAIYAQLLLVGVWFNDAHLWAAIGCLGA